MRDAFGGAFMLKLFLVFIAIYVGFTAISLNYAKAFKVKNKIIDYIESNELNNLDGNVPAAITTAMSNYISEVTSQLNYRHNATCDGTEVYCANGVKISKGYKSVNTGGVYYTVTTYVGWNLAFLNNLLTLGGTLNDKEFVKGYWKISGETRVVVQE